MRELGPFLTIRADLWTIRGAARREMRVRMRVVGDLTEKCAMSVRVRCRCGQELHLRYGEWVYVLLGLVVLCMVLNSLALLLIYFHIERVAGPVEPAASVESPASRSPASGSRNEPESAVSTSTVERERVPVKQAPKKKHATDRATATSSEEARLSPEAASGRPTDEPTAVGHPPRGEVPATDGVARSVARATGGSRDDVVRNGKSRAAESGHPESATAADVPSTTAAPGFFADEAPLVRLLLLEQVPGGLEWRLGFFLDEDRRLRQRALERLRSYSARVTASEERLNSGRVRQWLSVVRSSLEQRADGQRLLSELATLFPSAFVDSTSVGRPVNLSELLTATSRIGETFLRELPARSVRDSMRRIAADGLDCVVLVDVSQSMEAVLDSVRREIVRLWRILNWGLPGIRLGVVLYRDEVAGVLDFSMGIEEQLARLEDVEASGGGDVPEGIHLAIKQSLGLGVFDWRPDATKHLVVLGDAPPPYAEQRGLASLVRQARQQAGFRVHALGVNPKEGRESVPFFAPLATAGGGRSKTVDPAKLGSEIFLCLHLGSPAEVIEPLLAVADRLLSIR